MFTWLFGKKNPHSENDDFVSLSSHELRSPLSVIKWYSEMLLEEDAGPLTDTQRNYLLTIQSSNQKAIDLVRSLLNVSRLDLATFRIAPEEYNLNALLQEIIDSLSNKIQEKNIKVSIEGGDVFATVDKKLCAVTFRNLIENAIAYSPHGGEVKISISSIANGEEKFSFTAPSEGVMVAIQDFGIGIHDQDKPSLFTKMFKGKNSQDSGTGSGLGLYVAQKAIESQHGKVFFRSEEGKGSTFYVYLRKYGLSPKEGRTTLD